MNKKNQITIVMLLGILILIISFFLKEKTMSFESFIFQALFNIAFVLITIALVNVIWGLLGGEPLEKMLDGLRSSIKLLGDSTESGITRFLYANDRYTSKDWHEILCRSKYKIDLLGYTLNTWSRIEGFEEELINRVKAGVKIRVLFMDEKNPFLNANINYEQIKSLSVPIVENEIYSSTDFFSDIMKRSVGEKGVKGSFEMRKVKKGLIMSQICIFDDTSIITPYLHSVTTPHSPLIIIKGQESRVFKKYQKEFDSFWELNNNR